MIIRVATETDMPALEKIALATLAVAYKGQIDIGNRLGGFAEQMHRREVIIACTDDASAFILSERIAQDRWMVRFLMPLDMPAQTGRDLIAFALIAEHSVRPLKATDETFAQLNEQSQVERGTASSYQTILGCQSRAVTDAQGVKRATEIYMPAAALAARLGVKLTFAAVRP